MMTDRAEEGDLRDRLMAELEEMLALTDEVADLQARAAADAAKAAELRRLTQELKEADARRERRQTDLARLEALARQVEQARAAGRVDPSALAGMRDFLSSAGVVIRDRPTPTILEFLERKFIPERNLQEDANRHVQGYVRMFAKVLGDRPLAAYRREDVLRWVRTLEKVKTSYGKGGKDAAKSIEVILRESRDKPKLGETTIEKHITHLRQVFQLAIRHHRFATSDDVEAMFDDLRLGREVREPQVRKLWHPRELAALLRSPTWSGTRSRRDDFTHRHEAGPHVHLDAYWWLPVVALHTGMRLEEIAQLRHDDLARDEDGRAFIRVTDKGEGQRLKTKSSRRAVPLHPFLAELGFPRLFIPGKRGWVFSELKSAGRPPKRGGQYSEDFTGYRRAVGLYEELKDFHSFRHTLVTALRAARADPGVVAFMVGHRTDPSYERWEQTDGYTSFSVETYAEALERLDWESRGVDLSWIRAAARLAAGARATLRAEDVLRVATELRAARTA